MSRPIAIDRAGRIVLPVSVRRQFNLQPGSRLMLDVVAQRIELTPQAPPDPALLTTENHRTVLRASGEPFDAAAAVRSERQAQARRGHGK